MSIVYIRVRYYNRIILELFRCTCVRWLFSGSVKKSERDG